MPRTGCGSADLSAGWREGPYGFVHVDELGDRPDGLTDRVEVAIVGLGGEPVFHRLIATRRPLHRLVPGRPSHLVRGRRGPARFPLACPDLERAVRGRVVVAHGARPGWKLLVDACPRLRPLATLDSLDLARALLPGHRLGLRALAERLDMRPSELDVDRDELRGAMRGAVVLARVFERMVVRMLPQSTMAHLLDLGSRRPGDSTPELGLEDGR